MDEQERLVACNHANSIKCEGFDCDHRGVHSVIHINGEDGAPCTCNGYCHYSCSTVRCEGLLV